MVTPALLAVGKQGGACSGPGSEGHNARRHD